jgi:serine/threonine-protein kinase RsbW
MPDPVPHCEFEAQKLILKLDTVVDGHPASVSPLVEGVMKIVGGMRCAEGKETEVELALREALANAVVHGCKGDPDKKIECCVACDESRGLLIVIRDPGTGFDPAMIPSPVVGENIFESHGRGIFLINQLMDEVRYERGGTEIRMIKR